MTGVPQPGKVPTRPHRDTEETKMLTVIGWWPTEEDIVTARKVLTFALSEEVNLLTGEAIRYGHDGNPGAADCMDGAAENVRRILNSADVSIVHSWERYLKRRLTPPGERTA